MQIKTTMKYLVRMAIINKSTNDRSWRGCGERRPLPLLVEMQIGAATVENSMEFPKNIKNGTAL